VEKNLPRPFSGLSFLGRPAKTRRPADKKSPLPTGARRRNGRRLEIVVLADDSAPLCR